MSNWYFQDPEISQAPYHAMIHEVAHMYGIKDEYQDPQYYPGRIEPIDCQQSIMCRTAGNILQRHIEQVVFDICDVNGNLPCPNYSVVAK